MHPQAMHPPSPSPSPPPQPQPSPSRLRSPKTDACLSLTSGRLLLASPPSSPRHPPLPSSSPSPLPSLPSPPPLWNPSRTRQRPPHVVSRWRYLSVHFPSFLNLAVGVLALTPQTLFLRPPSTDCKLGPPPTIYCMRRAILLHHTPVRSCMLTAPVAIVIPSPLCTSSAPVSSRFRRARLCSTSTIPSSNHSSRNCRPLERNRHTPPSAQAERCIAIP
ncbi:hypothetical protein PMIN01_02211 [Paraphaeosphaeria minitans]|uniref:Uncharacterized protein n=1 Tax=Paraphaeosphaeria minitans TaxID=565426 RepID=A0A9P6GPP1_9PLEO|nr:hypothetical protein PMIN01_02211 [Paraphaeosphaeria minitans]